MIAGDMDQRLRYPVDERLGADEAMVGQHVGAPRHMLAAAKTDFKMQRTCLPEQTLRGNFANFGHRDLRQHRVDQILLPRPPRLALRSAVKAVEGGGIAGFVRRHGAPVSAARRGRQAPPAHIRLRARP